MDVQRLTSALAEHLQANQVQVLADDYLASAGASASEEGFLTWLHDQGRIGTRTFCGALVHAPIRPGDQAERGFQVLAVVGEGAQGAVVAAHDKNLDRTVALKRMAPEHLHDRDAKARFLHEARITAQLEHPSVVPVYDLAQGDDGPSYAMKLIHGKTLEELIDEAKALLDAGKPLDEEHALSTRLEHFVKVCEAMDYAHDRGVIHRDLKPANVMIGPWREVYVMDWGIAHHLAGPPEKLDGAIGTPSYMSPEQAAGEHERVGPASDQVSLGLILFELASLNRAITGKGLEPLFRAEEGDRNPLVPYHKREPIPPDLAAIIRKATAVRIEDRYVDVQALGDDVRRFLRGDAPRARPDNLWRGAVRLMNRYRQTTLLVVVTALLGAALLTIGAMTWVRMEEQQAAIREDHVEDVLTRVNALARRADATFLVHAGLLRSLAESAEAVLLHADPDDLTVYMSEDFADPRLRPPDTVVTPHYHQPVSFSWPAFKLAPGADPAVVGSQMASLVLLRRSWRDLYLRSGGNRTLGLSDAEEDRLLAEEGVPFIWSYVGTEAGVHATYPGHGGYPPEYDPRRRPWYRDGRDARGPTWGKPYIDVNGLGLLLPCVTPLRDGNGDLLGVAGVELRFDQVIDDFLVDDDLQADESYLVDGEGQILVRSGLRGADVEGGLHDNTDLKLEPLPHPAALTRIRQGESGFVDDGQTLIVFSKLETLGWYIVVTGPTERLLYGR